MNWSDAPQPERTPSAPLPRIVVWTALIVFAVIVVVMVGSVLHV